MRKRSFVQHPRKSVALATLAVPLSLMFSAPTFAALESNVEADYYLKLLGKYVFFDKISEPKRMACVTCHDPDTGGTGSTSGVNLHQVAITGANPHTVGNLKPPTNAYASLIPQFYPCNDGGLPGRRQQYCGGNFWSGRAEGYIHSEDASKPSGDSQYPNFSIPNFLDGVGFGFAKVPGFTGLGAVAGSSSVGGAATKHIGYEVFQGGVPDSLKRYHIYFGPTADQALNPMPNVVEQNKQRQDVCLHVKAAKYAPLYEAAWGVPIDCSNDSVSPSSDVDSETQFDISFKRIILAVCAWQASKDLDSFSSKRDKAIADEIEKYGKATFPLDGFTAKENYGHALFYGGGLRIPPLKPDVFVDRNYDGKPDLDENSKPIKIVGAGCAFCHSNLGPAHDDGTGPKELYTHQDYHNIGVPFNPEIPVLCPPEGCDPLLQPAPDQGLASHLIEDSSGPIPPGFFKTPTLRNVDKRKGNGFTKAYTHNGWFKSLESIVHFYNTADVTGATATQRYGITRCPLVNDPSYKDNPFYDGDGNGQRPMTEKEALKNNCWPEPQFANSAIPVLVGDLGLEPEDEAAIVAYLKTLTDEETATAPSPYKASKN